MKSFTTSSSLLITSALLNPLLSPVAFAAPALIDVEGRPNTIIGARSAQSEKNFNSFEADHKSIIKTREAQGPDGANWINFSVKPDESLEARGGTDGANFINFNVAGDQELEKRDTDGANFINFAFDQEIGPEAFTNAAISANSGAKTAFVLRSCDGQGNKFIERRRDLEYLNEKRDLGKEYESDSMARRHGGNFINFGIDPEIMLAARSDPANFISFGAPQDHSHEHIDPRYYSAPQKRETGGADAPLEIAARYYSAPQRREVPHEHSHEHILPRHATAHRQAQSLWIRSPEEGRCDNEDENSLTFDLPQEDARDRFTPRYYSAPQKRGGPQEHSHEQTGGEEKRQVNPGQFGFSKRVNGA